MRVAGSLMVDSSSKHFASLFSELGVPGRNTVMIPPTHPLFSFVEAEKKAAGKGGSPSNGASSARPASSASSASAAAAAAPVLTATEKRDRAKLAFAARAACDAADAEIAAAKVKAHAALVTYQEALSLCAGVFPVNVPFVYAGARFMFANGKLNALPDGDVLDFSAPPSAAELAADAETLAAREKAAAEKAAAEKAAAELAEKAAAEKAGAELAAEKAAAEKAAAEKAAAEKKAAEKKRGK